MSYLGISPNFSQIKRELFSGNGSTPEFILSNSPPNGAYSVLVAVSGVLQNINAYSVSGIVLMFSSPPPAGTNNIEVIWLINDGVQVNTLPNDVSITSNLTVGGTTIKTVSGRVLVGTTTDDTVNKLQVNGDTKITGNLTVTGNISGSRNWLIKTANYTAINGDAILADTSGGSWTLTLPATPAIGQAVTLVDSKGSFSTNKLTIARNNEKIMGLTEDMTCSTNNISLELIYKNSTDGWRII